MFFCLSVYIFNSFYSPCIYIYLFIGFIIDLTMTELRPKNCPYSRKWNVTSTMKILPLKSIGAKENNICVEFRITFPVINHFYPNSFITTTKRHIERKQPHARKQVRPSTLNTRKRFRFRPRKGISWESYLLIKLDNTTLQLTAQDSLRIKSMVISKLLHNVSLWPTE